MNDSFIKFRNEYPEFVYHDFNVWEDESKYVVTYDFRINSLCFKPKR